MEKTLKTQKEAHEEEIKAMNEKINKMMEAGVATKKEHEEELARIIKKHDELIEEYKAERRELKNELREEREAHAKEVSSLNNKIDVLTDQNKHLATCISDLETKHEVLGRNFEIVVNENKAMRKELNCLKEDIGALRNRVDELEKENVYLKAKCVEKDQKYAKLEQEYYNYRNNIDSNGSNTKRARYEE